MNNTLTALMNQAFEACQKGSRHRAYPRYIGMLELVIQATALGRSVDVEQMLRDFILRENQN